MPVQPCSIYQVLSCEKLGFNRILVRPEKQAVVIPIVIGSNETQAIIRAMQKEQAPRPMTHDLLVASINRLGGLIEKAVITKLDGGTFFANLVVKNNDGSRLTVDARPSDCMAIATLAEIPLFIDDSVIASAGQPLEEN